MLSASEKRKVGAILVEKLSLIPHASDYSIFDDEDGSDDLRCDYCEIRTCAAICRLQSKGKISFESASEQTVIEYCHLHNKK